VNRPGRRRIVLPIGCVLLAATGALLAATLVLGVAMSGCGGMRGSGAKRIAEREETVGTARVRLRSELSPARGTLGDPIVWRLSATLDDSLRPGPILVEPPPPTLEVDTAKVSLGPASREAVLRGFDIGAIPLPRAVLALGSRDRLDTLEFPRDTLFVDSLTPAASGSLRPDRGPIETPLRPVDVAVAVGAGLLALALLVALVRAWIGSRRHAREPAPPPPPVPPEEILEGALERLERELPTLPRDVFYERLAQSLREYAAARTGVDALDLTTSELDRALVRRDQVPSDGRAKLIAALRRADLAKFARYRDEESEARSIVRDARSVSGAL